MATDSNARRLTGIDALIGAPRTGAPQTFYAADDTTFAKWAHQRSLRLWQLVALHSNLDPDSLGVDQAHALRTINGLLGFRELFLDDEPLSNVASAWFDNLQRAQMAVQFGELLKVDPTHLEEWSARVEVAQFHLWATRVNLPVIDGWVPRQEGSSRARWPWGHHETELLRVFAEIGEHWRLVADGGPYDPANESSAPKLAVIEPLLIDRGISEKVRQAMFTILRPDGIRPGPRRRKAAAK